MATIAEALTVAFQHHEAGRLAEAEVLYARILDADPEQGTALHLLGVLCCQTQRAAEALPLFRRAAGLDPANAGLRYDLARARMMLGREEEAVAGLRQTVALQPDHAPALLQLALALRSLHRPAESLAVLERLLALDPAHPEARYLAIRAVEREGEALLAAGRLAEAVARLTRPVAAEAGIPLLHRHGAALVNGGRPAEASRLFRTLLAACPADAPSLLNEALCRLDLRDPPAAERLARRARAVAPADPAAHVNLGLALAALGRSRAARSSHRRALACDPAHATALANLAATLLQEGESAAALPPADRAVALAPDHADAAIIRGDVLTLLDRDGDAVRAYREAVRLAPDRVNAHWNLAHALLRRGDFAAGWAEYEWRWRSDALAGQHRAFAQPRWAGERLDGKTILVHAEQGLGDTIQFMRLLDRVLAAGPSRVFLEAHGPIRPLLELNVDPALVSVIPRAKDFPGVSGLPDTDVQIPLMSLATLFLPEVAAIPRRLPYLRVDSDRKDRWARRLRDAAPDAALRCGLVWAGRPQYHADAARSLPLEALAPLADVEGVALVSLQVGPASSQAAAVPFPVIDLSADLTDFAETAAAVEGLDLVVAVDTAVAHLAGALARPVWILLPRFGDWRWMSGRTDSPWYPTARLFRQGRAGDWSGPAAEAAAALRRMVAEAGER